ncbi:MAG: hypothetical protein LBQ54_05195 [Planctomycetaceae bacterium]|nr:hypothetical protein [Planctomycetaceae bacterium]
MALVALRLTVGWHFFYEGCWKIDPGNNFSAIPFLGMSKGPAAEMFYEMLPDVDGAVRLDIQQKEDPYNKGKKVDYFPAFDSTWAKFKTDFRSQYNPSSKQQAELDKLYKLYSQSQFEYAAAVKEEVAGYFAGYKRFKAQEAAKTNDAAHQRERNWDQMMKLRGEVNKWSGELSGMGEDMQLAFWRVLNHEQQNLGEMPKLVYGRNRIFLTFPFLGIHSWVDFLNFAVTWGLTAIGFCLMTGFCNRLAALGGAAFLVSVLLTQPPWPTIYPPVNDQVGHAMIVDKNFVEMIACLVLVSLPVGRWAGLDFFLWNCFGGKKLAQAYGLETKDGCAESCCCKESAETTQKAETAPKAEKSGKLNQKGKK